MFGYAMGEPRPGGSRSQEGEVVMHELEKVVNVEDALGYLDRVKAEFSVRPSVYSRFLDIMQGFKRKELGSFGVIREVACLFDGHSDLINGFNAFLPPGLNINVTDNKTFVSHDSGTYVVDCVHRVIRPVNRSEGRGATSPPAPPPPPPAVRPPHDEDSEHNEGFGEALDYVNQIKDRFTATPLVYRHFLDILTKYQKRLHVSRNHRIPERQILSDIQNLFRNDADLVERFLYFLPSPMEIDLQAPNREEEVEGGEDSDNESSDTSSNDGEDRVRLVVEWPDLL